MEARGKGDGLEIDFLDFVISRQGILIQRRHNGILIPRRGVDPAAVGADRHDWRH